MPEPATRARLDLTRLDDRTVPSVTATATIAARPFDFAGTGTLTTSDQLADGTTAVTNTTTSDVTLGGSIDYAGVTTGQSGTVTLTGTGTGSEKPTLKGTTGGIGDYDQTTTGTFSFTDANGVVATVDPVTGSVSWTTEPTGSGTRPLGPQDATGTFDTSTFKFQAAWGKTGDPSTGTLTATLANATDQQTDLAFGTTAATLDADGDVTLDFTANVTGNLMTAPSRTTAVSHVTAEWEGDGGQTQSIDLDVPVYWNTGTVTVHAAGLTPPAWAKTLTVKLDADDAVSEADETNNTWTVTLADLSNPAEPPTDTPPIDVPPPVTVGMNPVAFALAPGDPQTVQYVDASNKIIASVPVFAGYKGPITLAVGDMNGDGVLDVAAAAGKGGGPRVTVFDGKTGGVLADFFAYDDSFRNGVNVAVGDVDGDGKAEVITGTADGGGPIVRVFDAGSGQIVNQFYAFSPDDRGGVSIAAADLDGDGKADIVAAPGAGSGPQIVVFDGANGAEKFRTTVGSSLYQGGMTVSAAPVANSDAVIVTVDPTYGSLVRFRTQLAVGEPLLTKLNDPISV